MNNVKKILCIAIIGALIVPAIMLPLGTVINTGGYGNEIDNYIMNLTYDETTDIVMHSKTTQLDCSYSESPGETVTVKYVMQEASNEGTKVLANSEVNMSKAYPGALLVGDCYLADNTPNEIRVTDRNDVTLNINLPGLKENVFTVNPMNCGDVMNAINQKCVDWGERGDSMAAVMNYTYDEAESEKQLEVKLNVTAEHLAGLGIGAGWVSEGKETTYVIKYTQAFYTVAVSLESMPSKYFGPNTTLREIQQKIVDHKQAVIVDTTVYGSTVMVSVTSSESSEKVRATIEATLAGTSESLTPEQEETMKNMTTKVYIYGGEIPSKTPTNLREVKEYVENCKVNKKNITTAKPIQYTTAFINNGHRATSLSTAQYNEKIVTITREIEYKYHFDGAFISKSTLTYWTFDSIDEKGNYVNEQKKTVDSGKLLAGNESIITITEKHEPRMVLQIWGVDCDDIIPDGVSLYPLESIYYDHGGTTCNQSIEVKVDGVVVYED